jgi:hypothetical protein
MKRIILIIAFIYSVAFGQSWNTPVTTTISASSLEKMDLFTNKDGNHLLIKNSNGNIIYYNFNSSGTVNNNKTETLESNGDYPAITGSNDKVYAIYKSGIYIKGKYSTNGGTDWTAISNINVGSNACNGIDANYQDQLGVHLVYAMRDNDPYFETYYYRLTPYPGHSWTDYKNVTDYGSEVGGVPSVAFSSNRVHVSYNSGQATPPYIGVGVSKSRDKAGSSWQDPQLVSDGEYGYATSREKIQVRSDKLFCIFYDAWVDLGQYGWRIQVKSRDLTGSAWPGSYTTIFSSGHPRILMGAETTANNNLNVVHYYLDNGVVHKYYDGTQWSNDFQVTSDYLNYEMQHLGFSTVSNDLFVVWKSTSNSYIKYRQKDDYPLAPTGLTITEDANNHPKLDWNASLEPDRDIYKVYRFDSYGGGWQPIASTTATTYTDPNFTYCHAIPPATCENYRNVSYHVTLVDIGSHESDPSNDVTARLVGGSPDKTVATPNSSEPNEYSLSQNYPNPFNPITTIDYSIKSAGLVTLKVYDMLGNEVASLVNERKEPGNYNVTFDAANLPRGIYLYALKSGNFLATKKLILLK